MSTQEKLFTLTPSAIEFYKNKLPENQFLKFSTKSGCSGKKIAIEFVEKESIVGREVLEQEGVSVFFDKEDIDFLQGLEIKYVKSLVGGSIEFYNPNAKNICGCGTSWSS